MRISRILLLLGIISGTQPLLTGTAWSQENQNDPVEGTADISASAPEPGTRQSLPLEELQVFTEVFGKIKNEYVDEISDRELLMNAIEGMLSGLDPHSVLLEPEEYRDIRISTEGKFGGLGIEVTIENNLIKVVAPIDGTPAYDADIRSGDIIVQIDGEHIQGMNLQEAVDRMRGEPGTRIVLTISRPGETELLRIPLVRAVIKVNSVRGSLLEEGIGYCRVSSFQSGTSNSLRIRIEQLVEENGGPLSGLVLDLRNNPGGALRSAISVSDLFLESGKVVFTRGRGKAIEDIYEARPGDILEGVPMVILVNGGSASASEIVAGALQDNQRAIIMGISTFGKGSVQTIIPVNTGGALKLTTSRYYTPLDRSIQARGIEPDIEVRPSEVREIGIVEGVREADLRGHLEDDKGVGSSSSDGNGNTDEVDETTDGMVLLNRDFQLKEAFNLLKGINLAHRKNESAED